MYAGISAVLLAMRRRFALPDDDEGGSDGGADGLTHMGMPLGDVRDTFGALLPYLPTVRRGAAIPDIHVVCATPVQTVASL